MFRIAIVEDEERIQKQLTEYIHRYGSEQERKFNIVIFSDGDEILDEYRTNYDIIFLDIQMKRLDGMETAKKIRELDKEVHIVFITNMAQYAIQGYSVDATGFVLKPVTYFTFHQEMERVMTRLKKEEKTYITVTYEGGLLRLNTMDILYIESFGHRLLIHTLTEDYYITDSMKNMEQQLQSYDFFRCNNSYIVNLAHVESVQRNVVLIGKSELQISRPKKKAFMDALADYIGGITK